MAGGWLTAVATARWTMLRGARLIKRETSRCSSPHSHRLMAMSLHRSEPDAQRSLEQNHPHPRTQEILLPGEMSRWFSSYETIIDRLSTHLITPKWPDGSA